MKYQLKFRSHPTPVTSEQFQISRAHAKAFLKILNLKKELHDGEQGLKNILIEAMKYPDWEKMTLKKKS